jgi:hypothetical protein
VYRLVKKAIKIVQYFVVKVCIEYGFLENGHL